MSGPAKAAPRNTQGPGRAGPLQKTVADVYHLNSGRPAVVCPGDFLPFALSPPVIRNSHHVYVRPFNLALRDGKTEGIGRVRLGALQLSPGGPIVAPYSLTYVTPARNDLRNDFLDGRLHIFLGDRGAKYAPIVGEGETMRCDHITIEPTRKGKPGLSAHLTDASDAVRYRRTPLPSEIDGTVDVGTFVLRAPAAVQPAGAAIATDIAAYRRDPGRIGAAVEAALEPWHPFHTLPEPLTWDAGHHLSISFVLSRHAMADKHYPHHQLVHPSVVDGFKNEVEQPIRFQAVPLGEIFLIVILTVSPGVPSNELLWSMKRRA